MKTLLKIIGIALYLYAATASAQRLTVGKTYPIAEPNALEEIKEKAKALTPEVIKANTQRAYNEFLTNYRVRNLTRAVVDDTRSHIPWGEAPADVYDAKGNVLYPKGFRFNPLKFIKLQERIFVVDDNDADIEWLLPQLKAGDRVLLNKGDIFEVSKRIGRSVFIVDELSINKLAIKNIPARIEQQQDKLVITEVSL